MASYGVHGEHLCLESPSTFDGEVLCRKCLFVVRTLPSEHGGMGRVWTALRWQGFSELLHSAGRCGHVSGLCVRPFHLPLAIMPFARLRSRSKARTRGARPIVGFPEPAVPAGFVHSLLPPLPTSEALDLHADPYAAIAALTVGSR